MPAPPDEIADHPLRTESSWLAKRDAAIAPLYESDLVTTQQTRDELLTGAWLLGLLDTLHPQMLRVADMLAAGHLMNAVIMPRRSSKTTTLLCILLGRCYLRPVYLAGFTLLTTAQKARERYRLDIYSPIARRFPESVEREAFDKGAPVKLVKSNGSERVEFSNGSVLSVLSPDGDAVRSGAYDCLLLDEAGEASPERWADIISAVIPAFDTRPEGQLVLAGTAGDYRDGSEFWKTLHDERAGRVAYMLADDTDPDALADWEPTEHNPHGAARALTLAMHPGIGTLTTLERIQNSYERLGVRKYTREYFNLFGEEGSNTALIRQPLWQASALPLPEAGMQVPEVFALSAFVHPDAAWASVGAAWIGPDGRVHVGLLHHQEGVQGFRQRLLNIARKHRRPITFDAGSNATEVEMRQLREARPSPTERPLLTRDIGRAAVHLVNLINEDKLRHFDQQELNAAAEIAVKRAFGQSGGWAFGRPDVRHRPDQDITPIEAISIAAYVLDQERPIGKARIDFFNAA
ncbi:hypothetical protein [Microbacterium kunmingense]|uniref:hypothetical protein n=1 Tax=Microbacterium kunmingense TaxID=2915939 RepID=UPI0020038304|nr:hypothetical protein [Microbacterium kunmingense]